MDRLESSKELSRLKVRVKGDIWCLVRTPELTVRKNRLGVERKIGMMSSFSFDSVGFGSFFVFGLMMIMTFKGQGHLTSIQWEEGHEFQFIEW